MMDKNFTAALMALALAFPLVYAQEPAAESKTVEQTAAPQTPAVPELVQDPQIRQGVLENGLRYIVRPTKHPVGRACVRLFINNGSLNETSEVSGISHFIEHMVFNGSRTYKRGELIPAMQKLGLGLGGDANAFTTFYNTFFSLDLPKLDAETVDSALTIMRDFADGATLEDDAIDHERGIVISELKNGDTVSSRTQMEFMRAITPGTRLADFLPIGREEVIRNVPYETVREYYRSHYVPGNMTLIITGNVSYETAEKWVRKYFGDMPAREAEERKPLGTPSPLGASEHLFPNPEQSNLNIVAAVVEPHITKPDTIENRMGQMPLSMAVSILNKRLSRLSRVPGSPFLTAGVDKRDMMKVSDVFSLSVICSPGQWKEALAVTVREVRSAIEHGFTEDEVNAVVQEWMNGLRQANLSQETVTAAQMAGKILDCLSEGTLVTAPDEDLRCLMTGLQRLAADPDCMRRALAEAYDATRAKLIATGAIPEGLDGQSLRALYNGAQQLTTVKPQERKAVTFAYDSIGEPGKVVEQAHIPDFDVTTLTLSNGVRVNLKHTLSRKGSIHLRASIDGGSLNMPDTPGLEMMLSAVMQAGGLEAHDADELDRLLSGKQADIGFGIEKDRFAFTGNTDAAHFEFQCKLMVAHILHPGFREDGETQLRRKLPAFFQRLQTSPEGVFEREASRIIYGDDARLNVPTPEQMARVDTAQARAAVEPFLKDGAMELTIVGDYDKENIIPILERTFGAMPQRRTEYTPICEERRQVRMRQESGEFTLHYPSEVDRTIVIHVRPGGDGMDYMRNLRMTVLSNMVQTKIFDTLRTELGQAYSPSVTFNQNAGLKDAAMISCTSYGVEANRETVDRAMQQVCGQIGRGEFSEEDFRCALMPTINSLQKSLRTNAYWLSALSDTQSHPDKLERLRTRLSYLNDLKYEEMRELAIEVFGKDNTLRFSVLPAPAETQDTETPATPAP